jgi:hypothetical protein
VDKYIIEISMTPDDQHSHKPYFWCVLKLQEMTWVNNGLGWSVNPQQAWADANEYYQMNCT